MPGRRITTISLDDRSYEHAQKIGNLSAFVRQALEEEMAKQSNVPVDYHNAMRPHPLNICYPFQGDGVCTICWPYGRPSKEEWRIWAADAMNAARSYQVIPDPPRRSPDRRESIYAQKITEEKSSKAVTNNKGIIRKFISWIFCVF